MRNKTLGFLLALILLPLVAATANAQVYQPTVGQEGKDVIWVPTPEELVKAMLDMAKVTPNDYLYDLGSGDGRIVIAAAKRGVKAVGIEYNPDMVELSKKNAEKEGVSAKATFMKADIFETDFSQATVITMYLLPSLNMKLRDKILAMKPGTRIVSHAFNMEDWEPDQTANVEERTAYLWIVPAKVAGTWDLQTPSGPAELTLTQTFQKIEGNLKVGGKQVPLKDAKLNGDRITFSIGDAKPMVYSGRVSGSAVQGTAKAGIEAGTKWTGKRRAS